ncbi:hypothetical protein NLG97_g251 [Lecanicillium saksenae]|uniref:Uncharacterized protein n=1 Tax=Lecanicillium saksenae TaxID=468837 RepID=A0ACC1R762_9HYPO|nr:hypothetical protein NLG97_g251 [Lecanicillium saksenae]
MLLGTYLALLAQLAGLLYPRGTTAQFTQDYEIDTSRAWSFLYRPLPGVPPYPVLDTGDTIVYLQYNCYYMIEICVNAQRFLSSPRGLNLHPTSGISNNVFGYDLDTGDFQPKSHQAWRRDASCPRSWKRTHPCPEQDQSRPWKSQGQWYTHLLEPGTDVNAIRNLPGPFGQVFRSDIRYSCDEFPPATWVEGGEGLHGEGPSNTRCAAITCEGAANNTLAEQNWQGLAHGALRRQLEDAVTDPRNPDYQPRRSIILFRFLYENTGPDGAPARVTVTLDTGNAEEHVDRETITMKKRSNESISALMGPGLSIADLRANIRAGQAYETLIHENYTIAHPNPATKSNVLRRALQARASAETPLDIAMLDSDSTFGIVGESPPYPQVIRNNTLPESRNVTSSALAAARELVKKARAEAAKRNAARVAKPLRNNYLYVRRNNNAKRGDLAASDNTAASPSLLVITDEIAAAAALVAEADIKPNVTKRATTTGKGTFWMQDIARKGTVPWGDDANYVRSTYRQSPGPGDAAVVFRNVMDYGAVGDGSTDDTRAINKAMGTNSTRCDRGCNGSTIKNAIVYFPPGNYLVSSTLAMPFGTQIIGDANSRPTIVAAPSFVGLGVLSTDEYTGTPGPGIDGKDPEYFVNTANFYRQIRNIRIDIRNLDKGDVITGIHYQVAQATSTQNVEILAKRGSKQIGIFAENGSGGSITDISFVGGGIGLKAGSQQFTAQRLDFDNCDIGIQVIWDWGWVWKSIHMKNVGTGFKLIGDNGVGNIGSVSIMDSSFTGADKAIVVNPIKEAAGTGSTGISLENVDFDGVGTAVSDSSDATLLATASKVDQWFVGPVYEGSAEKRTFIKGSKVGEYKRQAKLLDSSGNYFERARPQYADMPASAFVHTKDLGCKGDGLTDDTVAFQRALAASTNKILFVDAGTYILTSTVTVPPGAKIVGETWSQLAASGSFFSDAGNPKPMLRVGRVGEVGDVEMQDLIFTTQGATAGAILLEWNIKAANPGSAGLWDCHARIGGALGTRLTPKECPPSTTGVNSACSAASLMMHLTKEASGYFENMWLWGADHMIDDPDFKDATNDMEQTSVYVARGFLIESTEPTWLYATASEHAVFYQYNFHNAANIFAGMIQTESPYYQPNPKPPAPFTDVVGKMAGDPKYDCASDDPLSGCDESWSTIMTASENIFIAAAGLYSWFSTYSQSCIDTQDCQKALILLNDNGANVRITNLVTIGAKYMAVMEGKGIPAADNLNVRVHPSWSQISVLDVGKDGKTNFKEYVWIDPKIWNMDQPQFTCIAPCKVKIPPWTGATSTANYPLVTVSDGSWTSTITQPPVTITEWVFGAVTIGVDQKKRAFGDTVTLQPTLTPTPLWPAFRYRGPNGDESTTRASGPFPTPPPHIWAGDAPQPLKGSWPVGRHINAVLGEKDYPYVPDCFYLDFEGKCRDKWLGISGSRQGADPSGDEENIFDRTACPAPTTTKTTLTSTTTTKSPPVTSMYEQGHASSNKGSCYNRGEKTERDRMMFAAKDYCGAIAKKLLIPGFYDEESYPFAYNGGFGTVRIDISLEIKKGCSFGTYHVTDPSDVKRANGYDVAHFDQELCEYYLSRIADGCNCGGVNGKQGVAFSDAFKRLCWPLEGTFPGALSVMKNMRGALEEKEPLQREDGTWHEIASLPLTEPKVSSLKAYVPMLDEYEGNWAAMHKNHETAEYETYEGLDEDDLEDDASDLGYDTKYLAYCCDQERPEDKEGLSILVTPAEGKEFVTIYDYVSVVHPWIMSLREDIIQAMTVLGDGTNMALELARAMEWKISVRSGSRHRILSHQTWLSNHTTPAPLDEATRNLLRAAGNSRDLTRP